MKSKWLLYVLYLFYLTWPNATTAINPITEPTECSHDDDVDSIVNIASFPHEDSDVHLSDDIEELIVPHEPIRQSARDQNMHQNSIPTLRINSEEAQFVPLRSVSVEAWIHTFAADVTLTQTFINLENESIEAIYVFPIEENAAVYSLIIEIDERLITAEIKEKKTAEDEYDEAITHGQTATLLRQSKETLDTFMINVGALPPGKECRVVIRYVTELDLIDGKFIRFVVPSTIAPRYNPELGYIQSPDGTQAVYVQNTTYSVSFNVHVERKGLLHISNLSHPINATATSKSIGISTESVALDRDYILDIHLPLSPSSMMTVIEQYDTTKYAALTALIPRDLLKSNYIKSEFIFIIDCSGSMMEESKIDLAREAMLLFVRSLPLNSYFNIIQFGSHYKILFDQTTSIAYNEDTVKKAEELSRSMEADMGGTELWAPLEYLKNNPPSDSRTRQVFLLTDGEISDTDEVINLCHSMLSTTRIFTFGLGHSPSRSLVKGLARATNGYFVFIPPGEKVDAYVGSQLRRALKPSIVNTHLIWHGLPSQVVQSSDVIPPLYTHERTLVYTLFEFERDETDQQTVRIDFVLRCKTIDSITLDLSQNCRQGDTIRRLAAKAMIQNLQHMKDNNNSTNNMEAMKQQIVELSLKHQILSPYTAFIGIEKTSSPSDIFSQPKIRHVPIKVSKDDVHLFANYLLSASIPQHRYKRTGSALRAQLAFASYQESFSPDSASYEHDTAIEVQSSDSEPTDNVVSLNIDHVRWLVGKQLFNGAWQLNNDDIKMLTNGKNKSTFKSGITDNEDVLTTAIAIALLESKYADQQDLWYAVVDKARQHIIDFGLTLDQINLLIDEIKNKL